MIGVQCGESCIRVMRLPTHLGWLERPGFGQPA